MTVYNDNPQKATTNANKNLTQNQKFINLTLSSQEGNGFSRPSVVGASALFGIALFLCQKFTFMVGVSRETLEVCRTLLPGLLTRFTPTAQSLVALCVGLKPQAIGQDYAQHIQHASSPCATTPQNPTPINPSSLHALKGCLPFAPCTAYRQGGVA